MDFVLKSCVADLDIQKIKENIKSNINKNVRALYISTDYDKRVITEVTRLDEKNILFKVFGTSPKNSINRSFSIDYFMRLDNDVLKLILSREAA